VTADGATAARPSAGRRGCGGARWGTPRPPSRRLVALAPCGRVARPASLPLLRSHSSNDPHWQPPPWPAVVASAVAWVEPLAAATWVGGPPGWTTTGGRLVSAMPPARLGVLDPATKPSGWGWSAAQVLPRGGDALRRHGRDGQRGGSAARLAACGVAPDPLPTGGLGTRENKTRRRRRRSCTKTPTCADGLPPHPLPAGRARPAQTHQPRAPVAARVSRPPGASSAATGADIRRVSVPNPAARGGAGQSGHGSGGGICRPRPSSVCLGVCRATACAAAAPPWGPRRGSRCWRRSGSPLAVARLGVLRSHPQTRGRQGGGGAGGGAAADTGPVVSPWIPWGGGAPTLAQPRGDPTLAHAPGSAGTVGATLGPAPPHRLCAAYLRRTRSSDGSRWASLPASIRAFVVGRCAVLPSSHRWRLDGIRLLFTEAQYDRWSSTAVAPLLEPRPRHSHAIS